MQLDVPNMRQCENSCNLWNTHIFVLQQQDTRASPGQQLQVDYRSSRPESCSRQAPIARTVSRKPDQRSTLTLHSILVLGGSRLVKRTGVLALAFCTCLLSDLLTNDQNHAGVVQSEQLIHMSTLSGSSPPHVASHLGC